MHLITLESEMDHDDPEEAQSLADESGSRVRRYEDLEWPALLIAGFVTVVLGILFLIMEGWIGLAFLVLGLVFFLAALVAHRVEGEVYVPSEVDREWQQKTDNETIKQDFEARRLDRLRHKDEIVKAVKSTIKVRCRYCGTLNDEGANKCDSCGGVL
jgi:hypothetical protein